MIGAPWRGKTIHNSHHNHVRSSLARTASIVAVLFVFSGTALADSFDDQIASLRNEANSQQATAAQFAAQANDFQSRVNQLNAQMGVLQAQINLNQAEYSKVTYQIAENEENLAKKKAVLSANLKSMYLESSITQIEVIASSKNLSDYFNQQQYKDSIKDKIQVAMADIVATQKQLATQKIRVEALLSEQTVQKQQLAISRSEANQLLATAAQSAAAANLQVKNSNVKIAQLKSQQAAALAAASRRYNGSLPGASGGSGGACDNGNGNGGYPTQWCNSRQDAYQTPWGYNRECVSWAGWRRTQMGMNNYGNLGNANTWDDNAPRGTVHSTPIVGAVAQTDRGYWGHVAVVEAIQGSSVVVSEMNYDLDGHYRTSLYPTSFFEHYIW